MSKLGEGKIQLNVRLSREGKRILQRLQRHYARLAGLPRPLSQAQALEAALRSVAKREKA